MTVNIKYKQVIGKSLLVIPFSLVMSLVGIATGSGFVEGWFLKWIKGLLILMPVGYLCALIFLPLSQTIISKIKWK